MPRVSVPLAIAAALAAAHAVRLTIRTVRELREYSRDRARLNIEWVTVRGVAGSAPLRMHALTARGTARSSPPVVLVHGFGVGAAYHVPLAVRLAESGPTFAPDLPGHGRSDHDVRPLSVTELAEALAGWMDALGLQGAVLVGHSYGCQIAAELAVARPDLISRVVLIGPVADPAARSAAGVLARAALTIPFERPSFVLLGLVDFSRAGCAVLATDLREMLAYRLETVLRAEHPALVIRGARDFLAPQKWAAALARLSGAPPPWVVTRCGHAVNYDAPTTIAALIRRVR